MRILRNKLTFAFEKISKFEKFKPWKNLMLQLFKNSVQALNHGLNIEKFIDLLNSINKL